jgi:ATP-binding cassette subfamily B protein
MPALQSVTGISFLVVLWYGGYRLLDGGISLGGFLMFNVYLGMLIWPMIAMGWVVNLMQRGSASLGRIKEILEEEPTIADPPDPVSLPSPLSADISFENVALSYGSAKVLNGIDLRIPSGATVAIVGHTGSGKSSLVQLIPRLNDPTSGCIRLGGVDIRDLRLAELRGVIGFVPQESFLFSATLAENIAFGVPDATEEEIRQAAALAGLEEDVAGFPDGYATMLGERGITLSGGQKQRTAIARALLRDPRVLILDDALSSVDTVTEERILTALAGVMRERTTILISHRVSTVQHADEIYVMEAGRIAEHGHHESLLAGDRWYADLYRKQLLEEELEST